MPKVAPLQPNEILFEDNHLLVVNKRAGLVTQGAAAGQPSLLELGKNYIRKKYNKPGNVYLGIVSRLDAKTSGAIVIARTSKAAARLSQQFLNRETRKVYWAIVDMPSEGNQAASHRVATQSSLENWIYKDEAAMRMRCVAGADVRSGRIPAHAKRAALSWTVIGRDGPLRLLQIDLQTGRKHQIRCQLAEAGFPIVGDKKYGSQSGFPGVGIALHSKSVEITHPTQKNVLQFDARVPDCWKIARYNL